MEAVASGNLALQPDPFIDNDLVDIDELDSGSALLCQHCQDFRQEFTGLPVLISRHPVDIPGSGFHQGSILKIRCRPFP
jgi:hypothetical protein